MHQEFATPDIVSEIVIESLVFELLASCYRLAVSGAGFQKWLALAIEYVHAHYTEEVTLGKVAARIGVHPAHLARGFRARLHKTLGEYVRELRLARASQDLLEIERAHTPHIAVGHKSLRWFR